jgi:ATP sulfurylase
MRLKAGWWWLMPVVLAIQEAEIRRITGQSQPSEMFEETLSQK